MNTHEEKGAPTSQAVNSEYMSLAKGTYGATTDSLQKQTSAATMTTTGKGDLDKPVQATKRKKFRRHCARFWLRYLIGVVIFLAIFLPLFFTKIIPAIAQAIVSDTDVPIYGGTLKVVSNDEISVSLQTSLSVPKGIKVKLDPLELWLFNEDTPDFSPFLMIPLESQTINGKTDVTIEETTVGILNKAEARKWLSSILNQKTTKLSFRGNTTAHLGALNFGVKLEKKTEVDALNQLAGFKLESARILLPPREDGSNLVGNLTLPNWSDLTLGLGNLTFNVWAGEFLVGLATVYNVMLEPGNTTMPFQGEVYMDALFKNLVEILGTQTQALSTGMLELAVSGNETTVNGEHITYLEDVLNEVKIKSTIPLMQLLSDVLRSVLNGDVEMEGLADVIRDGLGPLFGDLLEGLIGGGGLGSGGGNVLDILGRGDSDRAAKEKVKKALMSALIKMQLSKVGKRTHMEGLRDWARKHRRGG